MSSYAVLGATGNCGKALIQLLLASSSTTKVNAYCRNKQKLYTQLPELIDNKKLEVFSGSILDSELIASCIKGCKAVFMVVTTNDNIPGCRLGMDQAETVISALEKLKATLCALAPCDLLDAEAFLRKQDDWVSTIFIKPGGLTVDVQQGHKISLDHEESFIAYADLAAAMIETADDKEGQYDMKNVSVNNATGKSAKFPPGTPLCILMGLIRHFLPFLHPYLPSTGPA
ncbi:hypothetical protein AMS68_004767 [Peltaster fructicola]|uniref:NAD(P)-binding domain-containing protein n=1 Tax=Peltaster fructicola TaxID=286661 RepID=A0A6H0XXV5_9PEZI|nr:hypothetical protein AMS68_004767 [Peltaster fructicola]